MSLHPILSRGGMGVEGEGVGWWETPSCVGNQQPFQKLLTLEREKANFHGEGRGKLWAPHRAQRPELLLLLGFCNPPPAPQAPMCPLSPPLSRDLIGGPRRARV